MMTQEAFVNNLDQNQTAGNKQPDLWSTLSIFSYQIMTELLLFLAMEIYFSPMISYDLFIQ